MRSHGWKDGIDEVKPTAILLQVRLEARRYYSAKEFLLHGAPNFISKPTKTNDNRFLDDIFPFGSNIWYKYSNKPLTNSIKKFVTKFPIATDVGQPRLLLVSVDVKTVNFDYTHVPTKYDYSSHAMEIETILLSIVMTIRQKRIVD